MQELTRQKDSNGEVKLRYNKPIVPLAKQIVRAKEVVGAVLFFAGLIVAGILFTVSVRDQLVEIESTLERVQQVQRYQMLKADHHSNMLAHIAGKKEGAPPPEPRELRSAELELFE
jgi:hypothetical protein